MNICFVVAGMSKRRAFLEKCIDHFVNSRYYGECDIFCYYQGDDFQDVRGKEVFANVVIDSKPRGVFTPRYELMKRFAKDYDYTILIDDDLYIQEETDYYGTINFMEQFPSVGVCTIQLLKFHVKNRITINDIDYYNIQGGMVIKKDVVNIVLDYFRDKEKDYTFDHIWLLAYIYGYDLAKDFRSYAIHMPSKKVDGKYTGFAESRKTLQYVPIMEEYINDTGVVYKHGSFVHELPEVKDINKKGLELRKIKRKCLGFDK